MATSSNDKTISIVNLKSLSIRKYDSIHVKDINSVSFSPNGVYIVSGS